MGDVTGRDVSNVKRHRPECRLSLSYRSTMSNHEIFGFHVPVCLVLFIIEIRYRSERIDYSRLDKFRREHFVCGSNGARTFEPRRAAYGGKLLFRTQNILLK